MKLKPLKDRVIIKKINDAEKTKSGIILSSSASDRERNDIGQVVAVGNLIGNILIGKTVIYSKYAGTLVKDSDDEYLIISIDDILAIKED